MRRSLAKRVFATAAVALAGGTLFLPSCQGVLTTFNPCGNIFQFCDPNDVALLFTDVTNGSSLGTDPTCTIPFLVGCSAGNIIP